MYVPFLILEDISSYLGHAGVLGDNCSQFGIVRPSDQFVSLEREISYD